MADQEKDKQMQMQIDDMLDSLLANYSSVDPRPGLETRILANLILASPRDAEGREYLDAAGGAIVVNVGHGRREIAAAMADQA